MNTSTGPCCFATLSESSFARFSEFITRELGIKMPPEKRPMLQSRLQRRLRQLEMTSLDEYQRYLFNLPDTSTEWIEFINLVTTNKTDFFREPKHFDYLVHSALPALAPHEGGDSQLKFWCAGCSSGEESYTLAMVLSEYGASHAGFDYSILATDISTRVLDQASSGIYEDARAEPMGDDGAKGMLELKQAGAFNIAQDEHSCVVFGMPQEAIKAGGVDRVLPLQQIDAEVVRFCR